MTELLSITRRSAVQRMAVAAGAFALGLGLAMQGTAQAQSNAPMDRPNDPALIAAAKADGSLTLYGSSSVDALKADAEGFQKAYGIPVTYQQLVSSPLTARVDQEIKVGRVNVDVIISADPATLKRWVAEGHAAKLPDVKFPRQTEYLAPIQIIFQGILFNTAMIPKNDPPKDWNDVVNPKYNGKIVLGSPRIGPSFATLFYSLWKDPKYGEPFFQKLADMKARVVQTPTLLAQSVASGEAAIGFTGIPYSAVNITNTNKGAPIDYAYLNKVTMASTYVMLTAKGPKPNAGRLFAQWLMSREGQIAHNGDDRASSLLGSLPGTLPAAPMDRVDADLDAEDVSKEQQALIAMFDRLFK
ncbi:MAG: extracellular solute-binding protein [Alphaproteobacteria bacterium]